MTLKKDLFRPARDVEPDVPTLREQLCAAVAEFEAKGGVIEKLPWGATGIRLSFTNHTNRPKDKKEP